MKWTVAAKTTFKKWVDPKPHDCRDKNRMYHWLLIVTSIAHLLKHRYINHLTFFKMLYKTKRPLMYCQCLLLTLKWRFYLLLLYYSRKPPLKLQINGISLFNYSRDPKIMDFFRRYYPYLPIWFLIHCA